MQSRARVFVCDVKNSTLTSKITQFSSNRIYSELFLRLNVRFERISLSIPWKLNLPIFDIWPLNSFQIRSAFDENWVILVCKDVTETRVAFLKGRPTQNWIGFLELTEQQEKGTRFSARFTSFVE